MITNCSIHKYFLFLKYKSQTSRNKDIMGKECIPFYYYLKNDISKKKYSIVKICEYFQNLHYPKFINNIPGL